LPFIRKEFEMSNAEAGGLMSLFLLAYALAQIPSGFAFGRFGVSRILPGAMVLTSLLTGLVGTASSLLALKLYRLGLGVAEGPLPISMTTTINNWFPAREKGTASGIFLSAVKFGPVIVPPLCAVIIFGMGLARDLLLLCRARHRTGGGLVFHGHRPSLPEPVR
jgi:sugar phosphate permease